VEKGWRRKQEGKGKRRGKKGVGSSKEGKEGIGREKREGMASEGQWRKGV